MDDERMKCEDQEPAREAVAPREGACGSCPQAHECRAVWSQPNQGPFSGGGLVLSSITAFLLPIVTAITGGGLARELTGRSGWIAGGVALGLAAGVALAWLLVPVILRKWPAGDGGPQEGPEQHDECKGERFHD